MVVLTVLFPPAGLICAAVYASRARDRGESEANYWVGFAVTAVLVVLAWSALSG